MSSRPTDRSWFDEFAGHYDAALARGLSISGEDKHYFAQGRLTWLAGVLKTLGESPKRAMDFGCGTGSSAPLFFQSLGAESVIGVDSSPELISLAAARYASASATFLPFSRYRPAAEMDLVYCNGVFHHVPPEDRLEALDYVFRSLRSGGLFSFWENNPWNPGTRYVMSRIPFDRDAVTLSPPEARRLLRRAGFHILRTDSLFIFPRSLRRLRWIEPWLASLPLGAQYQVLCRRS
jgi:SAM-dependent methyltransferase